MFCHTCINSCFHGVTRSDQKNKSFNIQSRLYFCIFVFLSNRIIMNSPRNSIFYKSIT